MSSNPCDSRTSGSPSLMEDLSHGGGFVCPFLSVKGQTHSEYDGNYHQMASNPFIESHRMCMVFPLGNDFLIKNGHFRLKHNRNRRESSKSSENKCTHWALRLVLIGKHAHRKGNIKHVRTWSQAISINFGCLFQSKITQISKDKCNHRSTNTFYASISTHRKPSSVCGYTP